MWLTIILFTLLLYVIYRIINFWIIRPYTIQRDLANQGVPGQYTPIVGDVLRHRRDYYADKALIYLEEANAKFGDYYHTSFGPFPCLITSDPGVIESVLKTNTRFYHKNVLVRELFGALLNYENLLLAEDDNHTRHRQLTNPIFQHQNLNSMIPVMVDRISNFLAQWQNDINDKTSPLTLDISKEMSYLTLDIIFGCVFGVETMKDRSINDTIYHNLQIAFDEVEKRIYNVILIIPILNRLPILWKKRIDKCKQDMRNAVLQMINLRKQGLTKATCKGPDLLDQLLVTDGDNKKEKFSDEDILNEALTFVIAGHDTPRTLIIWALYYLVTNPDVYQELQNEVDSVLSKNQELTVTTVSLLTYTEAVLKETLRYHHPAPLLLRTAMADNTIVASDGKQIRIRKGTDIFIVLNILNRSEKYWHESNKFDPSRFLENHVNVLFPFGYGPHTCIGQNFAMLESKIILAMMLHRFRFELIPGQKIVQGTAVTVRPKYGLSMRVWSRSGF
ncbi:unnamed protein product [Rotaria sordida]|uniref:Cytochrome P450 n=1 Tax=Rotaria sordida TaxID=392033 RepID=A0A814PRY1_9BILA|nr:unnamed protein product [Rotaria sordida]CAF1109600.1 unnamed protein product [Rotaria sordida]CAF3984702.1 unnamed protein product [Rotaria sordida]CAF4160307.1 unnamed protein product [Rotaria sordida]